MRVLKFAATFLLVGGFILLSAIVGPLLPEKRRRRFRIALTGATSRLVLGVLGVRVQSVGKIPEGPCLVVSNHVSYLDVLVISSRAPSVFITSVETHETPLLGTICRKGGSRFVERRTKAFLVEEVELIQSDLQKGLRVALFPESTTGSGEVLLPFRNSLFAAAERAGVPVVPLCLNYLHLNGERPTPKTRDCVCYYGSIPFHRHFLKLISLRRIEVELDWLSPIATGSGPRREIARQANSAIQAKFIALLP